jgi:hypothetical protein
MCPFDSVAILGAWLRCACFADATTTNAAWKNHFALWALKRAGAKILLDIHACHSD